MELKRPATASMEELDAVIDEIEATQEYLKLLKERLNATIPTMAQEILDPVARREAANYLYWMVPEARVGVIAESMAGVSVHQISGTGYFVPVPSSLACTKCGKPATFANRTKFQDGVRAAREIAWEKSRGLGIEQSGAAYRLRCKGCRAEHDASMRRRQEERRREDLVRAAQLLSMDYSEYRNTPAWRSTRNRHLGLLEGHCEVCTQKKPLDVYHRSRDRQGSESRRDLVGACDTCAERLFAQARIHSWSDREPRS